MKHSTPTLDMVFQQHYGDLLAWCRKRVDPRIAEPEDLVHLTYLRCLKSWRCDRGSGHYPAAYVLQSMRWVLLDELRRHTRRNRQSWGHVSNPAYRAKSDLGGELVCRETISRLPESQREVCEAIMEGKSDHQICRELGLQRPALAVRLSRAKKELERRLGLLGNRKPRRDRRQRAISAETPSNTD